MNQTKQRDPENGDLSSGQIRFVWAMLGIALFGITAAFIGKTFFARPDSSSSPLKVSHQLPEFELIDSTGQPFKRTDLKGKTWIADFIFTRCGGPCPTMSLAMSRFQKSIKPGEDIKLVSITVDPDFDTQKVLSDYASSYVTKPKLWYFLTGPRQVIRKIVNEDFKLPLGDPEAKVAPNDPTFILHSTYFVLVDGKGRVRGYYDTTNPEAVNQVLTDAKKLAGIQRSLPTLNALLNSTSCILLITAYIAVRKRRYALHRSLMIGAIYVSAGFLVSYLTYHFAVHLTKPYEGPYRQVYLALLISHSILAATVLPLVLITAYRAVKAQKLDQSFSSAQLHENFRRHMKIARWTFPIWLYVSFTGVIVYLALYQLPNFLD